MVRNLSVWLVCTLLVCACGSSGVTRPAVSDADVAGDGLQTDVIGTSDATLADGVVPPTDSTSTPDTAVTDTTGCGAACSPDTSLPWCTGRYDGTWCDGATLITCLGGAESARAGCAEGCVAGGGLPDACLSTADPFCGARTDGGYCDGSEAIACVGGAASSRTLCTNGCNAGACSDPNPNACVGKANGGWCDGNDLVWCVSDDVSSRVSCPAGCESMPAGTNDRCRAVPFCTSVPAVASPAPPTASCNYMDWYPSPDGFYLISQFGTSNDGTTWGHGTTCGVLQSHYNGTGCRYDTNSATCLDDNTEIPWIQGDVDYDYQTVLNTVDANLNGAVPAPEYFYVADAQRFGCGAVLRMSNSSNGRCVVVYTEDGGPGSTYEMAGKGGRRIVDSSPAVVRYLQVTSLGWANSTMMYLEWGLPGDVPGQPCTPCQSTPVKTGTMANMPPWDPHHMMPFVCR